jgi:hypothetical protein
MINHTLTKGRRELACGLLLGSFILIGACNHGAKQVASPTGAPASSAGTPEPVGSAASSEAPPAASAGSEGTPPSTDAPAAGASTAKPSRPPRDVLEAKDTVFFLDYDESAPMKTAEAACTKRTKKDAKKMAGCMAKARDKIDAEGQRFIQDKKGEPWYVVLRKKGSNLIALHKVRFTYGTETADSIVIKPQGRDAGSKPWKKPPTEIKFEVPSDDRIVVEDRKLGKLVYEAKVGITGN